MDASAHFVIEKLGEALMTAEGIIEVQQGQIQKLQEQLATFESSTTDKELKDEVETPKLPTP